jgi:hypothetical protein
MGEVKYNPHHSGNSPEQRVAARLKTSGDTANADRSVVHGTGPTRTHTHIFERGQGGSAQRVDLEKGGIKPNLGNPGEGSIIGTKRGVV